MEPLPGQSTVVQPSLPLKYDIESRFQHLWVTYVHDDVVRVLKESIATKRDTELTRYVTLHTGKCNVELTVQCDVRSVEVHENSTN